MNTRRVRPVNVAGQYELYIGVRPPITSSKASMQPNAFLGDRIFLRYDDLIGQFDVGVSPPNFPHENC